MVAVGLLNGRPDTNPVDGEEFPHTRLSGVKSHQWLCAGFPCIVSQYETVKAPLSARRPVFIIPSPGVWLPVSGSSGPSDLNMLNSHRMDERL